MGSNNDVLKVKSVVTATVMLSS